ncbi:fluoride efflux transporter CrcB [Criibacterium bergeronii]|uniref:Fluoride-specific ion channel FluC n=1 Tax=Criibacterium bergeronii TaxID=1871336 RepID=A0A371IMH7_9FIRM|nr:fluoride efflux transporter CrcB [Criibacterium bergeronii]MBS6062322.1 fluoride efflux transporter CrcB [Peptostreptococcaceae bacterium]RDY21671.1 fluoride efflux transporter CrcB [Criibacterium bergeronii]
MSSYFYVFLGGGLGAFARYLLSLVNLSKLSLGTFPINTFITNIVGSFVIGLISAINLKNSSLSPQMVLFLKTGICGGFTTFSTFSLETFSLLEKGNYSTALIYMLLSSIFGILSVALGYYLVR